MSYQEYTEIPDQSVELILFNDIENSLSWLIEKDTIKSIEIFNSQMDFENEERPRLYPYVAIEILVAWNKHKARNNDPILHKVEQMPQDGIATVNMHHVFSTLENETKAFKETQRIRHLVHRSINELQNKDHYTKLLRGNSLQDSSHGRVIDLITEYTCMVTELAYLKNYKTKTLTEDSIVINKEYKTSFD